MARAAVGEVKSFASLGPLLLARKGTAKPAMRVQLDADSRGNLDAMDELAASQEALGWNDMGDETPAATGMAAATGSAAPTQSESAPAVEPAVRRQQHELVHRIADSNLAAMQEQERPDDAARRAAFTLRLDAERHLRLRLASTVNGESAQAIVTRALDSLLAEMPEIDELAAKVRAPGRASSRSGRGRRKSQD
ncbi:hypothetical protein [Alteraurantiacibacter palmitatis]|uniref:Uncharacterized protein n=1 Tax=Alteraurantiacibacter palmitatis TaxID=2054628 RepID=A0ABV7E9M7_9SPHN